MTDISILGLGPIGKAVASALLKGGISVTVWNRTAQRAADLLSNGAKPAVTAAAAIEASPITLICLHDYEALRSVLTEAGPLPDGRILVQLSTGTPRDARLMVSRMEEFGLLYLDGAILSVPSQLGRRTGTIFVSGDEAAYKRAEPALKIIAPHLLFTGVDPGAASALDLVFISFLFGGSIGFLHGAMIAEAEGLDVAAAGSLMKSMMPGIGEMIARQGTAIAAEDFLTPESTLKICRDGMALLLRHAAEAGIDSGFPRFGRDFLDRGVEAGYGEEKLVAMVKVLRSASLST